MIHNVFFPPVEQVIGCPGPKRTKTMTKKHNESDACDLWVTFKVIWLLEFYIIHWQSSKSSNALKSYLRTVSKKYAVWLSSTQKCQWFLCVITAVPVSERIYHLRSHWLLSLYFLCRFFFCRTVYRLSSSKRDLTNGLKPP